MDDVNPLFLVMADVIAKSWYCVVVNFFITYFFAELLDDVLSNLKPWLLYILNGML